MLTVGSWQLLPNSAGSFEPLETATTQDILVTNRSLVCSRPKTTEYIPTVSAPEDHS